MKLFQEEESAKYFLLIKPQFNWRWAVSAGIKIRCLCQNRAEGHEAAEDQGGVRRELLSETAGALQAVRVRNL